MYCYLHSTPKPVHVGPQVIVEMRANFVHVKPVLQQSIGKFCMNRPTGRIRLKVLGFGIDT